MSPPLYPAGGGWAGQADLVASAHGRPCRKRDVEFLWVAFPWTTVAHHTRILNHSLHILIG